MRTVLLTGLGALGRGALELLARSPGVDRIVTVKRSAWDGPSRTNLTMIGAVFQGHAKRWEHHRLDLADTEAAARLLAKTRPDAILHSATVQSPRRLMNARVAPDVRAVLRQARFGIWLPWHVLPAIQLMDAVVASDIDTRIVNASFPDVVNPVLWRHFGRGPVAGAGNVEVCVAQIVRYLVDVGDATPEEANVSLVGSHALLSYGPDVPHHLRIEIGGRDVTRDHPLEAMLAWPEPIDWSRVDEFSLFAASAVKNVLAVMGDQPVRTHVSGANGLPGGYPVRVDGGTIELDLPAGLDTDAAIALNQDAARWDGIEEIGTDATVVYTESARDAMEQLGLSGGPVAIEDVDRRAAELSALYERLTTMEGIDA